MNELYAEEGVSDVKTLKDTSEYLRTESMTPNRLQKSRRDEGTSMVLTTTQYLVETINQLQTELDFAKRELEKKRGITSNKVAVFFLIPGTASLILSVILNQQVLSFIGLGLTFWGALFLFVKPVKYVKGSLLDSTAIASYSTLDRMLTDLDYKGRGYYIPPYPKEAFLPQYLRGLKDMVVFLSADGGPEMPSIDEIAKKRFILENPKGICVSPPGMGLLSQFEREIGRTIDGIELSELCQTLPQVVLMNLQLAKELEIKPESKGVRLTVVNSVYKKLYWKEQELQSVLLLGCPLVSAVACALAKSTGKILTISESNVSAKGEKISVFYLFVED